MLLLGAVITSFYCILLLPYHCCREKWITGYCTGSCADGNTGSSIITDDGSSFVVERSRKPPPSGLCASDAKILASQALHIIFKLFAR